MYASWFRALAEPARARLLNLLAIERRPMAVREIVECCTIGQSTVSHHLKILTEARFVLSERRGTSTLYRVNETCLERLPAAVRTIMGQEPHRAR
ncbi:ArsR family transcriptional regulator [Wenjunlia vitaminophila]|uniref:ArsR family transcriptional regulator n=2 Tax=Wenjunlia vitaminophila TaxID=76728 RepID=A0A0T6LQK3_WENVI|nr:ArsR family transcriptional regulator [Wenjunlia vitaminophila]